jgi:hypothetical protein
MGRSQYTNSAKAEFAEADNADAWVVAYAMVKGYIVVTQEGSHPNSKRKIFIPDVCQAFVVQYIDTFKMMRRLEVKL